MIKERSIFSYAHLGVRFEIRESDNTSRTVFTPVVHGALLRPEESFERAMTAALEKIENEDT